MQSAQITSTKLNRHIPHHSTSAWIVLAALVVIWEIYCPEGELLSEAVDRWIEVHPILARIPVLLVAAHLANFLPDRIDPMHLGFLFIKSRMSGAH